MFRLPLTINNTHSRRKSACSSSSSVSEDAAYTNEVEEKLNLEEELFRLRESTKAALQQSWDEVESLQQQCAAHLEFTSQLEEQLMEVRDKEDAWRVRCLAAEMKLQASPEDQDLSKTNNKRNLRETMFSWTSTKSISQSDLVTPAMEYQTSGESAKSAQSHSQKDEQIEQLLLKVSSRDEAVISLERTVEQHVKAMQYLQAETMCSMETQRIKEKNIYESHRRKEERLEKVIEFHRKKLANKDDCVEEYEKKLSDYRIYIEELTAELAKVLQLVKDAEESGVTLEYNLSHSRSSRKKEKTKCSVPETVSIKRDIQCDESLSIHESLYDEDRMGIN